MLRVIEELAGDWRRLDQRIDGLSGEIEALARQDQACSRLMTAPGIGPIISSAMVAAIGTGDVFSKGRGLRRLAWTGAQTDLDGRPHNLWQNLEAWQSLPARSVRAGGMGCAGQDKEPGTLRAQILDRSRKEAVAPQRAGDRARQQACPHRLGEWPDRGLSANENARALISMMAPSTTHSNQRPDTLMQDRRRQFDEIFLQPTARPYIGSKSAVSNGHRQTAPARLKRANRRRHIPPLAKVIRSRTGGAIRGGHLLHERSSSNDDVACSLTVVSDTIENLPDLFQIWRLSTQQV